MEIDINSFPKDMEQLREKALNISQQNPHLAAEIIVHLFNEMEKQKHYIARLQRMQFGPKSERLEPGEQVLPGFADVIEDARVEAESVSKCNSAEQRQKNGHGRRIIPADLPREDVVLDIPENEKVCGLCATELKQIGEEVSEKYERTPARSWVKRYRRKKYACPNCRQNVVTAKMPPSPIDKGLAGTSFLAQVIVSKYGDHLPLYRQHEIYKREGIDIPETTMCDWVHECAMVAEPIYDCMKKDVLNSYVVNTDDTPVPVLDASLDHARTSRMHIFCGDDEHNHIVYNYAPNHEKRYIESFLQGFKGYLQADANPSYNATFKNGDVKEVGCWAHARRYFFNAQVTDRARAGKVLAYIGEMYHVEARIKAKFTESSGMFDRKKHADEIKKIRQEQSVPVLQKLRRYLESEVMKTLRRSPIGEAIHYALEQWEALMRYTEDGMLEIDNNRAERGLKAIALGRKNYMFFGGDAGGKWAAIHYSLIASCKINDVEPFAYLQDILERVLTHPPAKIYELMPRNWKKRFGPNDTS